MNIINLKPIEFKEDNKLQGINIDLLTLISNKLDINIEQVYSKNGKEAKEYLENGTCDILPLILKESIKKDIIVEISEQIN